jgi:excisionase family DNA binding protein
MIDFENEKLFTADEIARFLRISKSHTYQMIRENKISYIQLGKSIRVTSSDLQRFISDNSFVTKKD